MVTFQFIDHENGRAVGEWTAPLGHPVTMISGFCEEYGYDAEIVDVDHSYIDHGGEG